MYVTRPLSLYINSPEILSENPREGPYSGYLVVQDEESLTPACFGHSKSLSIKDIPLPSNKILSFGFTDFEDQVLAIPVIDQPLSSKRYYMIKARKKHKGEAYVCSKDEDKGVSCGRSYIQDKKPRPLDPEDKYQQFEFSTKGKFIFSVKSIASDGHLPKFLRSKSSFRIHRSLKSSSDFIQLEAHGLNSTLRSQLPDFDFPISKQSSASVHLGKWLTPSMFIRERKLEDQVDSSSLFYEVSLEQRWQRIFSHDSSHNSSLGNKVVVDVVVPTQVVRVYGKDAVIDERSSDPKVTWFEPMGRSSSQEMSVGLSGLVIKRMVWEEKRVGWENKKERELRVFREEEYGGIGWWVKFGCYVLVERFAVKRMDGSLVLTCDFMHTHQMKTKWE